MPHGIGGRRLRRQRRRAGGRRRCAARSGGGSHSRLTNLRSPPRRRNSRLRHSMRNRSMMIACVIVCAMVYNYCIVCNYMFDMGSDATYIVHHLFCTQADLYRLKGGCVQVRLSECESAQPAGDKALAHRVRTETLSDIRLGMASTHSSLLLRLPLLLLLLLIIIITTIH